MLLGGNGVLLCTFELCHDEMPMFPLFQLKESKSRERLQVGPAADVFLGNKILDLIKLSGEWTQTGTNEETGPSILTRPLPDSLLSTFVFSFFWLPGSRATEKLFKRILQSCICDLLHDTHERLGLFCLNKLVSTFFHGKDECNT